MGVKNRRISFHMHSLSSAELKHNYPQTLFSSPMLLLPHATPPLFDFPRNFRGILLPIPNKRPAGKLWQLLVSANRTECYQHTAADPPNISIFAKMDRYIFTSCKKNKSSQLICQRHADHLMCLQKTCWSSPWQQRRRTASCAS